jgi:hypothetical protein
VSIRFVLKTGCDKRETKRHIGWLPVDATPYPIEGTQHPPALYLSPGHVVSIMPTPPPPPEQAGIEPSGFS